METSTITPDKIRHQLGKLFIVTFIDGSSEILSFREFNEQTSEIKCLNMAGCIELQFDNNRELEEIEADGTFTKTIQLISIKDYSDIQLHKRYN
jgi:hypothetical protein